MCFWCQAMYILVEHNRGTRNRLCMYVTLIWSLDFSQGWHFNGGKESLFNKWFWNKCTATCKQTKQNLDALISCHTKINLKWITDLTVRAKTKISKWKHWSVPCDPGLGKAQLRVQNFYSSRDTVKKSKRQALAQTSLIKICAYNRFYKGVKYWKKWMSISFPRKIYKWQTSTNA